jgi:hypothetical protein
MVLGALIIISPIQADPLLSPDVGLLDYSPIFEEGLVQFFKPSTCKIETMSGFVLDINRPTVAHCGEHDVTITGISKTRNAQDDEKTTHVLIELVCNHQKIRATFPLQDFPAEFVDSVEFYDLNGDGKDDFIVNLSAHGNGLAAELGGTLFLLSSKNGYRYLAMADLDLLKSISRYVHFGNTKQAVIILQRLVMDNNGSHSTRAKDGKSHTFFIFDLLQFDTRAPKGAKLNSGLDIRFPFWTLFTIKPSHEETRLLSSTQKNMLWHDPLLQATSGRLTEN